MKKPTFLIFLCLSITIILAQNNPSPWIGVDHKRGDNLLVLRLAVSCTGEYTTSVGGVAAVNTILDAWLIMINEMYGREFCIRFELIPNNDLLIFTDAGTDPWATLPGGSGGCTNANLILDQQATVIDGIIGAANYDISHVILGPPFGGGCAGGFKTGLSGGFDFPVTRHEMGHQFSQPHTISNGGNNNFELSGGNWSMQGGNGHPYAHATTYHSTVNHITTTAAGIGTNVPTGNSIPLVNAGPDVAIPISTPFVLSGTASDADAQDVLNYIWDTMDGGIDQGLPITDQTQGSLFMRLLPSTSIARTIPAMTDIINNLSSTATVHLPTVAREINVKLTVNDNHKFNYNGNVVNASGINSDDKKITVVDNGGPFLVTNPNTAVAYTGGSNQNITWNVNGTNLAPINTSHVKISLSTDGGMNFPIVVSASTPNDGTELLTIPNINTNSARIKIEAIGNIYFDISNENFTINQNAALPGMNVALTGVSTLVSETGQTDTYDLALLTVPTGPVIITLSADSETELSTDGTNFTPAQLVTLSNTTPQTITVRGRYDSKTEGPHVGVISHVVTATNDMSNYPIGMIGEPVIINIADAQMPPVIGIDFDETNSTNIPNHWVKITDIRTGNATNIPLDDGTPTTVSLTTTATNCGVGGCGFNSGTFPLPQHAQSLEHLRGVSYTQGTVTFTWSGLKPSTAYRVFVFGLGVFGPMDQTVSIAGTGAPVVFNQTAATGTMYVNDQPSSNQSLLSFGKQISSSGTGTIVISVNPNATEMSFAGLALQEVLGAPPGFCPNNHNLTAMQNITQKYETNGEITSNQSISGNSIIVTYDSQSNINLNAGFEISLGPIFNAVIDGCEGSQ